MGDQEAIDLDSAFIAAFNDMADAVHKTACNKGWHDSPRSLAEEICLMHSELSEALEGVRRPGPDRHCPEFSQIEVEFGDVIIRLMDSAKKHGLRVAEALVAKAAVNEGRAYRHGGALL